MEAREINEENFIECLSLDFPHFKVTKNNLSHPTSRFVISFYTLILRHVIELENPDEVWNLTEDQRDYMNNYHPEASTFGQHVWANNLHAAAKYVFVQLGQNGSEFVYSDILFPENTPRRSFVFMALMLNFYCYSNYFADGINSDMNACVEEGELIKQLRTEKEDLLRQIEDHENQIPRYAESIKEIMQLMKKSSDENDELENVIKDLVTEEEILKKELEKGEEEEQKLQEALTKVENEKKYAESLIVSNQGQVIDVHQKHLSKKDECVKKIKNLEEQAIIGSNKVQKNTKVVELQKKLIAYLKEEKFLPDLQGKGFHQLFENLNNLNEKKMKLSEEKSNIVSEVQEAEEKLPRLESEFKNEEAEEEDILAKGKEKTGIFTNLIDSQKKTHSQLIMKMRKDAEEMEEFAGVSKQMNSECDAIEERIKTIDTENKDRYLAYVKDMTVGLRSLQDIFGDDKKFF